MNNGVHNLVSELDSLKSEERNPNTLELDQMPTRALVQAINDSFKVLHKYVMDL